MFSKLFSSFLSESTTSS